MGVQTYWTPQTLSHYLWNSHINHTWQPEYRRKALTCLPLSKTPPEVALTKTSIQEPINVAPKTAKDAVLPNCKGENPNKSYGKLSCLTVVLGLSSPANVSFCSIPYPRYWRVDLPDPWRNDWGGAMRRISLRFTSAVDAIYAPPKQGRLTVTLIDSCTCKHYHFKIITVIITITTITTTT